MLTTALAGLSAPGARAQSDIFTVGGVEVDRTAETASAAREAALAEGHRLAMQRLLARLLPRDQLSRVRVPEVDQIVQFVRDFEVANERRSDVRYLASLTFRFKPDAVRTFLRDQGAHFAETQSKPVMILPVYGRADEAELWSEANPWWQAWARRRFEASLVPTVLPLGDLADIASIDADQALLGDAERLRRLAERYGAEDVLVSQAVVDGDPAAGQASVRVATARVGSQPHAPIVEQFRQNPDETLDGLLARAAESVSNAVAESWKERNLLRPGSQRTIAVSVPVSELSDWLEVKRRLTGVAAVQNSQVSAISREQALVDITFIGDEQQLTTAMAQSDLNLELTPEVGWLLWLGDQPRPTVEPRPVLAPRRAVAPGTAVPADEAAAPPGPGALPESAVPPGAAMPPGAVSPGAVSPGTAVPADQARPPDEGAGAAPAAPAQTAPAE